MARNAGAHDIHALQRREDGPAVGCIGILIGPDSNVGIGEFADNLPSPATRSRCIFQHAEGDKFNRFLANHRTEHISCITREQRQEQKATTLLRA